MRTQVTVQCINPSLYFLSVSFMSNSTATLTDHYPGGHKKCKCILCNLSSKHTVCFLKKCKHICKCVHQNTTNQISWAVFKSVSMCPRAVTNIPG